VTVSGVDSVSVRFHLYERRFRAKPVRRLHTRRKRRGPGGRQRRRARQCRGHSAVLPDDDDKHLGRERPPPEEAWGEEGGSEVGVAHAPDASATAADSRADCDTGGTQRRPDRNEVDTAKNIAESNATRTTLSQPQLGTEQLTVGGTLLPRFCSPGPARHSYASCVY
jgi:hypothetical protein